MRKVARVEFVGRDKDLKSGMIFITYENEHGEEEHEYITIVCGKPRFYTRNIWIEHFWRYRFEPKIIQVWEFDEYDECFEVSK